MAKLIHVLETVLGLIVLIGLTAVLVYWTLGSPMLVDEGTMRFF